MSKTLEGLRFARDELEQSRREANKVFQETYRKYEEARYNLDRLARAVDSLDNLIEVEKSK